MINILTFFDFDGTLIHSPLPDNGKIEWANYYNKPYPHLGWWGRSESLDLNVFNVIPNHIIYQEYLKFKKLNNSFNVILTSRIPKLKQYLADILYHNDIYMDDILCADGALTKGERIVKEYQRFINDGHDIKEIYVWEDRNKEIITIEPFRKYFEDNGVSLIIYKVQSEALD